MRAKVAFVLLGMTVGRMYSQTTLTGVITLQNSGNQSAYPAQIMSWGATATDIRSADGVFVLVFDRKQPGDDATLDVLKDGYEVVNREALHVRLPDPHTVQRPLKIYLCPRGRWQVYADSFYQVNLREINKSYQKKLADVKRKYHLLETQNQEYQAALAQLETARKAAESQAQYLAEKFARSNLDDASERYRLAYRLFSEAKIDSVLIVLQEEELLRDLEAAEREIAEGTWLDSLGQTKAENGRQALRSSARALALKGRLHTLHEEWNEAERSLKASLTIDSTLAETWVFFGQYVVERLEKDSACEPLSASTLLLDILEKMISVLNPENQTLIQTNGRLWADSIDQIIDQYPEAYRLAPRLKAIRTHLEH